MPAPEIAVVGDIGGTNMRVGVASVEGWLDEEIVPTPHDPDHFFKVLGGQMLKYIDKYDAKIGAVGFPGPVRVTPEGITAGPFENIAGLDEPFDIHERLEAEDPRLSGFGVLTLNDAEAQTHACPSLLEKAGEDIIDQVITFYTQSTGIGGDSIKNGVVCSRADGTLAEYGHTPVALPDGTFTTLEKRASGTAIRKLYGGGLRDARELYLDPDTQPVWDQVGSDLGFAIASLAPVLGMKHVVIGGGVSVCHPRYDLALRDTLAKAVEPMPAHIVDKPPMITYVPTKLIDVFGLMGALHAVRERYAEVA
jgi:predicted NBD/HSP70 family sugar kinase